MHNDNSSGPEIIALRQQLHCLKNALPVDTLSHLDRVLADLLTHNERLQTTGSPQETDPQGCQPFLASAAATVSSKAAIHQQYAQTLQQSEARFQAIAEQSPVGLCITDDHGIFEYVNPAFCHLYGYKREELLGQAFTIVVPPEGREVARELHDAFIAGCDEIPAEWEVVNQAGQHLTVLVNAAHLTGYDNCPKKATFVVDITRRRQNEATLRESQRNLQRLFDGMEDFVLVLDKQGQILHVNPAVQHRLGYSAQELCQMTIFDLHPSEQRAETEHTIAAILAGETDICAIPMLSKQHVLIPVETRVAYGIWDSQEVLFGITRDMTERKKAEEALRAAHDELELRVQERTTELARVNAALQAEIIERRRTEDALHARVAFTRLIITISTNFITIGTEEIDAEIVRALKAIGSFAEIDYAIVNTVSNDGTHIHFSHVWQRIDDSMLPALPESEAIANFPWLAAQFQRRETVSIPRVAELPPEAAAERCYLQSYGIRSFLAVPMVYGESLPTVLVFCTVQQEQTWSADTIDLLRIAGQIFTNALQRKQAEKALHSAYLQMQELNQQVSYSYNLLLTLFDGMSDGLLLLDSHGRVMIANQALAALLGCSVEALVEQPWRDLCYSTTPAFPGELALRSLHDGCAHNARERVTNPDGQVRVFDMQTLPLSGTNPDQRRVILHVVDMTETLQLQARVIQNERFTASGRLAASVAHEINTPLQTLQNSLDLVRVLSGAERDHFLNYAIDEIQRIGHIVRQLLDLYRPSTANPGPVVLNLLLERILLLMGKSMKEQGITVELKLANVLPMVWGRADDLTQVLLNMMLNALEAMPHGGTLTVCSRVEEELAPQWANRLTAAGMEPPPPKSQRAILIDIQDTGQGIAPELQQRVFEPFVTTRPESTGLGLAISSEIIRQHGGVILVDSEYRVGSTFTIFLPVAETRGQYHRNNP